MSGRPYRVVKTLPWIEGGRPAPDSESLWEGGRDVVYKPGDTVFVDDQELAGTYHHLKAMDDLGCIALEEVRAKAEAPARIKFVTDLQPAERSNLAWALASTEAARGEDLRGAFLKAIRNGADLPANPDFRNWFADVFEGKHGPKRGKGRPRKPSRLSFLQVVVEHGIHDAYRDWLAAFERDRELAWLRSEALRLRERQPDLAVWRRAYDLGKKEDRLSFASDLKPLRARPCPKKLPGGKTPRELALSATARQCRAGWRGAAGKFLTAATVARIVSRERRRARKPE